jgi:NAD(P)-dependent dehydrogenase (short-subunit alcohol dehydrogenase family)
MSRAQQLFDLSGRTAAITGAASGMGRATAHLLSDAGANVVLGDINPEGLAETVRTVEDKGGSVSSIVTDVTKQADLDALVAKAVDDFGRLDIMGNIAGLKVKTGNFVVDTPEEDLDFVMNVNFKGVWYGSQAALKVMIPQRSGAIVSIASSVIDMAGAPKSSTYSVSKAAVAMLTKVLATEAAPHGIRVNAVSPGWVASGFTRENVDTQEEWAALQDQVRGANPLQVLGQPEHIAQTILFLVSDAAEYVTGQNVRANGGTFMPW